MGGGGGPDPRTLPLDPPLCYVLTRNRQKYSELLQFPALNDRETIIILRVNKLRTHRNM